MSGMAADLIKLLRRFLQWWLGELVALVPERLRRRLRRTSDTLVFVRGDADARVYLQTRQDLAPLGRLDVRSEARPVERLRTMLEARGLARAAYAGRLAVCIRIPAAKAARTVAELPLAAEENLDDVVSFELSRHTPFSAEQAVFSYRVLSRDMTARRLRVEFMVVPHPIFQQFMTFAHELDIEPDRVDVAEPNSDLPASGNLIPAKAMAGPRGADVLTYALAAAVVCLAIAAVYLPVHAAQQRAELAQRRLVGLKTSVEAVAKVQKEIEAMRGENNFLVDRKRERPSVSELLFDTTRILPDDTWLQDWQINGGQVQLTGFSRSASALVPLLEQSQIVRGTTFRSPVTQDPQSGRERFNIAADIIGKERP
jgi:general secretion pathway protein L